MLDYTNFCCPDCWQPYMSSLSPLHLGTGRRRCPNCGAIFCDGSREWPELTRMERFEYVFPATVLVFTSVAVILMVVALVVSNSLREWDLMAGVVSFTMVLPWLPYFLSRRTQIVESKERYARKLALGGSDELILPL